MEMTGNARSAHPDLASLQEDAGSAAPGLHLSSHDVQRLLTEETPDIRMDVVRKVADQHSHKTFSLRELTIAEQIFRLMLKDTEVSVRETLAQSLKDNPDIPRDIIVSLTQDIDIVAMPVLEASPVLSDNDLLAILQAAKEGLRPVAVARRKHVSEKVSAALVETRNLQAVTQLMSNPGAVISEKAFHTALQNHGKQSAVATAIAHRPDLPVTVVESVITMVSDSLAALLRTQYKLAAGTAAAETEKSREIATLRLVDGQQISSRDVEKLVDQLHAFGRLTPSIILTSLCRGNLYFFEASLARLSGIPVRNAQLLIHDKGGLGFKALYSKAGLPEKFLAACRILLDVVAENQRTQQPHDANAVARKLLHKTAGQNVDNLSYILALIRQSV